MLFKNVAEIPVEGNVALTTQRQDGALITVYRRQATGRQAIMTPNNFIHELGHALDGRAGFGFNKLGSMEYAADDDPENLPTTRESMGRYYLRATTPFPEYYEHANIVDNGSGIANFPRISGVQPTEYDKENYLQYDIFGNKYALWNSDYNVYNFLNMNTRIDIFIHNSDSTYSETVADGFLNWVRNSFINEIIDEIEETQVLPWTNFFNNNIGMFLRNAAIYTAGMTQYYQIIGVIPPTAIVMGKVATYRWCKSSGEIAFNTLRSR